MSKHPTCREIAEDRNLWAEYVDPDNNDPEAFDRLTVQEKIDLQNELWPAEADEQ